MSRQAPLMPGGPHGRIVLAALAALTLAASLVLLFADRQPPSRATPTGTRTDANLGALAAQIQAHIAAQGQQSIQREWEIAHHEVPDPALTPPATQIPAIERADRVVRRWLRGYLPYEVDKLDATARGDLVGTSTVALAGSLLAHPPLIPPTQQQHRPPEGRLVNLITTITAGGHEARVYVEVAYGLARAGLNLTLTRTGADGWLVTVFQG
jgi:hypothetical protein